MNVLKFEAGGAPAALSLFLIDNSVEIDPDRVRPAVIVVPGGGYLETSFREADPIAIRMLAYGYQVFVLRYATEGVTYPTALCQVARAVDIVRQRANQWHVDPDAIVLAGFSAGGHLCANLGVEWNGELLASRGFIADSIRPNGLLLGYPVISSGRFAHRASFDRLLGPLSSDPNFLYRVSLEKRITPDFPPFFVFHTMTDQSVPVENSFLLIEAARAAGVEVEAHLYPQGRHGVSLGTTETMYSDGSGIEPSVLSWPELFHRWADARFLPDIGGK